MQSALTPAGPAAQDIATLTSVLTIGATLILLVIMALLVHGVVRDPGPVNAGLWVVGGGIVFPVVVLSLLWLYSGRMTDAMAGAVAPGRASHRGRGPTVVVGGSLPRLRGRAGDRGERDSHPGGHRHRARLTSPDVIHSFWVPSLGGKVDMVPGHVNRLSLRADRPGVYRGQCAEYCGTQHAQMALDRRRRDAGGVRRVASSPRPRRRGRRPRRGARKDSTPSRRTAAAAVTPSAARPRSAASAPTSPTSASRRTLAAGTLANDAAHAPRMDRRRSAC